MTPKPAHIIDTRTALLLAVTNGNLSRTRKILDLDPSSLKVKTNQGWNVLHQALAGHANASRRLELLQYLVSLDFDLLRQMDNGGLFPLNAAIERQISVEEIEYLVDCDKKALMIHDSKNCTLLFKCVCAGGNEDWRFCVVDLLLSRCVEAAQVRGIQFTVPALPAHLAAEYCSLRIFRRVLEAYPDALLEKCGLTPFEYAIFARNVPVVEYLCAAHPQCAAVVGSFRDGSLPLHFAASVRKSSLYILQLVYETNPSAVSTADCQGWLPVHELLRRMEYNADEHDSTHENLRNMRRFLISKFPASIDIDSRFSYAPFYRFRYCRDEVHRLVLNAVPDLTPQELADGNYAARRMALFLGCWVEPDAPPCTQTIFHRLQENNLDSFKTLVSFL